MIAFKPATVGSYWVCDVHESVSSTNPLSSLHFLRAYITRWPTELLATSNACSIALCVHRMDGRMDGWVFASGGKKWCAARVLRKMSENLCEHGLWTFCCNTYVARVTQTMCQSHSINFAPNERNDGGRFPSDNIVGVIPLGMCVSGPNWYRLINLLNLLISLNAFRFRLWLQQSLLVWRTRANAHTPF